MPALARVGACAAVAKFTMFRETCIISIRCAVAKAPAVGRAGAGIYSKFPDMGCSEVPQVIGDVFEKLNAKLRDADIL